MPLLSVSIIIDALAFKLKIMEDEVVEEVIEMMRRTGDDKEV